MVLLPLYLATCGYGQTGRVRSATSFVRCEATIRCGASLQLHASFTVPTLPKELPLSVSGRLEGKGDAAGAVLRLVF
jgi:hypothetical protein